MSEECGQMLLRPVKLTFPLPPSPANTMLKKSTSESEKSEKSGAEKEKQSQADAWN